MSLMRAIRFHKFGSPSVLQIDKIPKPQHENHQVLIQVKSVGINPVETYFRDGVRNPNLPLPHCLGTDGAGTIESVGKDVKRFKIGQRVAFYSLTSKPHHGSYADYTVVDEGEVWPLSEQLTFNQGAAIGIPYFTAYRAIVILGKAKEGETILIHGASGAVGLAAIQISKQLGLVVIGTAGTKAGEQVVKENGAKIIFNHKDENHFNQIKEATGEKGVDIIVEMLANINLGKDLPLLAHKGRVLIVGSRGEVNINPRDLMMKETSILGVTSTSVTAEEYNMTMEYILKGSNQGWLTPVVGKEYPFNRVQEAHQEIIHGTGTIGKMVLNLDAK